MSVCFGTRRRGQMPNYYVMCWLITWNVCIPELLRKVGVIPLDHLEKHSSMAIYLVFSGWAVWIYVDTMWDGGLPCNSNQWLSRSRDNHPLCKSPGPHLWARCSAPGSPFNWNIRILEYQNIGILKYCNIGYCHLWALWGAPLTHPSLSRICKRELHLERIERMSVNLLWKACSKVLMHIVEIENRRKAKEELEAGFGLSLSTLLSLSILAY